jgi:hypothetical protein
VSNVEANLGDLAPRGFGISHLGERAVLGWELAYLFRRWFNITMSTISRWEADLMHRATHMDPRE